MSRFSLRMPAATPTRFRVAALGVALALAASAAGTAAASGETGHADAAADRGSSSVAAPAPGAAHPGPEAARPGPDERTGVARAAEQPRGTAVEPSLTGSAKLLRGDGDDVRFSFDAHGLPDAARGTFSFRHIAPTERGYALGRIDCLVSGGQVAVATGIVTKTDVKGLKGLRVGFTVHDKGPGKPDRVGYSWAATNDPTVTKDLPPCVSSAPFETVERGDFKVVSLDEVR